MEALLISGDNIFYSVQGEGITIGTPAVFLRLEYCNLRCSWCDTKYAWGINKPEDTRKSVTWDTPAVLEEIQNIAPPECHRLIITGGEPLLQQKAILELIEYLPEWDFEVETNGTIIPLPALLAKCQFNCSPKLAHSGNPDKKRIVPVALKLLATGNTWFKFVVTSTTDVEEIERDFLPFIQRDRIILMPLATTRTALHEQLPIVTALAQQYGYRVSTRLHIEKWSGQRGV